MAMIATACTVSGIALRTDERLEIRTPGDRDKVRLPLELTWESEVRLDRPSGPRGYAVFLDREPMRPGRTLRTLMDDVCERTPGCPDVTYLAERDIYVTNGNSVVIDRLPDTRPQNRTGARDQHEAVIVLIDDSGRRIGESAFAVEFFVERDEV
jgi:hypothetical protein